MFKAITYNYNRYNDWDDSSTFHFTIEDASFKKEVKIACRGGSHRCGGYRDSYAAAIVQEYKAQNLNVAQNIGLFYAWYYDVHLTPKQKLNFDIDSHLTSDALYINRILPYSLYVKNYFECVLKQIKKLQYCGKLPKAKINK